MTILEERRRAYAALLRGELERLTAALRDGGAELVVLFGSYARGRADLLTDLDILAVMPSDLPFVERTVELYRRLAPRVAADILAYTPEEWAQVAERPFFRHILGEGKVLYAKRGAC